MNQYKLKLIAYHRCYCSLVAASYISMLPRSSLLPTISRLRFKFGALLDLSTLLDWRVLA